MNIFKGTNYFSDVLFSQHPSITTLSRNKRLYSVLLVIFSLITVTMSAQAQFEFTTSEDGGSIVTGYTGPGGNVVIPSELGGNPVTGIADRAFYIKPLITSITIPEGVRTIGESAFEYCVKLTSITFPEGVTTIGDKAFLNCIGLTSITIPKGVTTIGDKAFSNCRDLTSITIPEGVVTIGDNAFDTCYNLPTVNLPQSLTHLGNQVFANCGSLRTINVESGNPNYSSQDGILFNTNLTEILLCPEGKTDSQYIIPSSVTSIGDNAFIGCSYLTNITIGNNVKSIGAGAFSRCNLTTVTIGNSVESIGDKAFISCESLSNLTIGNGVKTIGFMAFLSCENLIDVTIPDSVKSIAASAFSLCNNLETIDIPDSVTYIGEKAFASCDNLTSVTIGNGVESIGIKAFGFNLSLTSISVSEENTSFSSVDGILFNRNQTTLIQYPEANPENHFTIPSSVTSIAEEAMSDCVNLISINIPKSVTSISDRAFARDIQLKRVFFAGDAPIIEDTTFNISPITFYYLPGTMGWSDTFAGHPAILWNPQILTTDNVLGFHDGGFLDGKFRFGISGAANVPVIVEACSDLTDPNWEPIASITFENNGRTIFTDPDAVDPAGRYYRFRPH